MVGKVHAYIKQKKNKNFFTLIGECFEASHLITDVATNQNRDIFIPFVPIGQSNGEFLVSSIAIKKRTRKSLL